MSEGWLEEALRVSRLSVCSQYPRDLKRDIPMALNIRLVALPRLTTRVVCEWLDSKNFSRGGLEPSDKTRHGYMTAWAGRGIIFYDEDDGASEQRFTLAHEVSHFVIDHLQPRHRALSSCGPGIQPVLDGKQVPTTQQRLSAVLKRIPLGTQHDLMGRDDDTGDILEGSTMEAEQRADRLAFELLAPEEEVLPLLRHSSNTEVVDQLCTRFGLPWAEARSYVRDLRALEPAPRPFLRVLKKRGDT